MQSFQERFKEKSSTISKLGEIAFNTNRAVNKPSELQMHSPVIKSSGKSIVRYQGYSDNSPQKVVPSSASHDLKIMIPKRQSSQAPPMSFIGQLDDTPILQHRNSEFQPYTLADYSYIRPKKYYILGGLGASTVGTEVWNKRKEVSDRRKEYANEVVRKKCFTDYADDAVEKNNSRSVAHARHFSAFD